MIKAEIHSDDHVFEYEFDAEPWFKQATALEIKKLVECGFGGDYPADDVAHFLADQDPEIEKVLDYCRKRSDQGFEVHINEEQALDYICWIDSVLCYPPEHDEAYRLCPGAKNNWLGVIENKNGDEIINLSEWAVDDWDAAFKFAQDTVRAYNKARFGIELPDYGTVDPKGKFVRVEYDPDYYGGNYTGVGSFALIPLADLELGIEEAFEKQTKLNRQHIIHYSLDEVVDENGE
jgi:hypothetical protein